jgi:hypothetical protein
MVGNFSNTPYFDPQTHKLELKPEYIGVGEIRKIMGQVLVIFDTETTTIEMYPYYYYNGLDDIFLQVEL